MHYHQMLGRPFLLQEDHLMSKTMMLSGPYDLLPCSLAPLLPCSLASLLTPLLIMNLLLRTDMFAVVCPPPPNRIMANFCASDWGTCQQMLTTYCVQLLGSCLLLVWRINSHNWRLCRFWYESCCAHHFLLDSDFLSVIAYRNDSLSACMFVIMSLCS